VFPPAPSGWFHFENFAKPLRSLRSEALNRKGREDNAKDAKKTIPRRRSQGMPVGWGGRKPVTDQL